MTPGTVQLVVLIAHGAVKPSRIGLVLLAVSGMTYVTVGDRLFRLASERRYQHVLTAFITMFGLSLFL